MPHAKSAAALGVVAALLCGCSSVVKPSQGRGKVEDPRVNGPANYYKCLQSQKLPVQKVGRVGIQIGALPAGPTITFLPTPSAAQAAQIEGSSRYQGAEVIGSALLYPNQGTDSELSVIETCLSKGVTA